MKAVSPLADEALAACAGCRGPEAAPAFETLVLRYGVRLLGLLRTCGVPEREREDVAQEVWLRAWRALPAWRPDHFRGWLFQVARTTAEDHRRKSARRPTLPQTDNDLTGLPAAGATPDRQ